MFVFRIIVIGYIIDQHICLRTGNANAQLYAFHIFRDRVKQFVCIPLTPAAAGIDYSFLTVTGICLPTACFVIPQNKHIEFAGNAVPTGKMDHKFDLITGRYRNERLVIQEGAV